MNPLRTARGLPRALRTALGATVLVAVTAGVLVSGDPLGPAPVAAGSAATSPGVQVDPVLGGPVGIDPTGPRTLWNGT